MKSRMKKIFEKIIMFSPPVVAFISCFIIFNPKIPSTIKIYTTDGLLIFCTIILVSGLIGYMKWVENGFRIYSNAITTLADIIKEICHTAVFDPILIDKFRKENKPDKPIAPNNETTNIDNLVKDVLGRVVKLEQDSPMKMAKLSIFMTIGIGVIGLVFLAAATLIIKVILKI